MSLQHIGVIGAGTMGNGIAQIFAVAGLRVTMVDISDAAVDRGIKALSGSLDRLVKKDKLEPVQNDAALARVQGTTDCASLKGTDMVIEAAIWAARRSKTRPPALARAEQVAAASAVPAFIGALARHRVPERSLPP